MKLILPFIVLCMCLTSSPTSAQTHNTHDNQMNQAMTSGLPYASIPEYPEAYTAGAVCARLIDGLGFRYYWATEGLTDTDLAYQIDSTIRTSLATLEHIHGLSQTIVNSVDKRPNVRPTEKRDLSWAELRAETLNNLKHTSDVLLTSSQEDLEAYEIVFQRGDKTSNFPFWHQLNGPIADALWHVGQVVTFRRASGNPIDSRISVFSGTVRER